MGLSYGYRAKECKNFKELKEKNPSLPDGTYKLFPNGEDSAPISCYCVEYRGRSYQAVWTNFGGPVYNSFASNVSNQTLFGNQNTYNGLCIPYSISSQMKSQINKSMYDYWKNRTDVVWYKRVRAYNSNGTNNTSDVKNNYDTYLTFDSNIDFATAFIFTTGILPGYISKKAYFINTDTEYDFGHTRYRPSWNSNGFPSIGLAGLPDIPPNNEPYLYNASAPVNEDRHVFSYRHDYSGRDCVRCQPYCWSGSVTLCMEITWFVREKDNDE